MSPLDPTRLNLGGAGGSALPEPVQRKMEAFYKTDFSDVRVHVGPQAASIGALAFTLGSTIYFAPGQYNPHSMQGQQLLGHELAHVLQQRAGRVRNPQGSGVAVVQDPHLEAEADRLGRQAAAQPMMPVGGPVVQRPGLVQAKPAAGLPGARPLAPHVQAALAAVGQLKVSAAQPGGRPVAPHVQAAVVAVGQPKLPHVQPGGRPLAPHVQTALAAVGQPKPAWSPPVTRSAVQPQAAGHKLIIGTYMHLGPGAAHLPPEAAGHTFVAVEGPGGHREAYGFTPADPKRYDFQRDIGQLRTGVPGAVQRENGAFAKPGVKTRTYEVSPEQARAALAKVAAYKTQPPAFSLARQDCGRFATEVLKAAKIDDFTGPGVKRPAEMYRRVQAPEASVVLKAARPRAQCISGERDCFSTSTVPKDARHKWSNRGPHTPRPRVTSAIGPPTLPSQGTRMPEYSVQLVATATTDRKPTGAGPHDREELLSAEWWLKRPQARQVWGGWNGNAVELSIRHSFGFIDLPFIDGFL